MNGREKNKDNDNNLSLTINNNLDTSEFSKRLDRIERTLNCIFSVIGDDQATEDYLLAENSRLKQELEAALADENLSPAAQEKINLIYTKLAEDTSNMKKELDQEALADKARKEDKANSETDLRHKSMGF